MAKKNGGKGGGKTDYAAMLSHGNASKSKNNPTETAKNLAMHLAAGAVGATAGSYVGKPSGLIGIGVMAVGFYMDYAPAVTLGTGMLFGSVINEKQDAKARVNTYFDNITEKVYLDKVFKKDTTVAPTAAATSTSTGVKGVGYLPRTANAGFEGRGYQKVSSVMPMQQQAQMALPSVNMPQFYDENGETVYL